MDKLVKNIRWGIEKYGRGVKNMQVSLVAYQGMITKESKAHTETLSSLSSGDDFLDIAENYFKSISSLINQEAEKLAFEGRDCQRNGRVL